jgi:hypothetical protein
MGQVSLVSVGLVILVLAEYGSAVAGVLITAPLWGAFFVVGLVSVRGRALVSWLPIVGHWMLRRALHRTQWLSRPLRPAPGGSVAIPGLQRPLDLLISDATGAAYLADRQAGTVTAIVEVTGRGFVLADSALQDHRVGAWGRVLASLCQQPDVVRLQVVHRTAPCGSASVRRWWATNAMTGAPWASRLMAELLADAEVSSDRQQCLVAVALRRSGIRHNRADEIRALDQQLATFASVLAAAEIDVRGWLPPARLRHVVRSAYDPTGASLVDPHSATPNSTSPWVGAMAVTESWDSLRTDSAQHAVYWIQEWPRSDVHPGFLQPLTLSPGARRAFTLLAEPVPASKAFREIRRAKVERAADAAQRSRIGRIEDEATRAEAADLVRREQDLVAGHGDMRFVGLVTVSATTGEQLATACRATETAAAQAMCELRLLAGQQGQAFAAAALPLARGLL